MDSKIGSAFAVLDVTTEPMGPLTMRSILLAVLFLSFGCADPALDSAVNPVEGAPAIPPLTQDPMLPPGADPVPGSGAPITSSPDVAEETCDGYDNDVDGYVDEGGCACDQDAFCFSGPPETRGLGVCRDGVQRCDTSGEFIVECSGSVGPSPELCNGLDNDCDGEVDEDCCVADPSCEPPETVEHLFSVGQQTESVPVDFVMVIDNSGSMRDTVRQVETNLGSFSRRLVEANIDYRFVMVSELARAPGSGGTAICVPEPMAGPGCTDSDRFRHFDRSVGSHSALANLVECFDGCGDNRRGGYKDVMRPGSLLQFIVVSDDEARMSWDQFIAAMRGMGIPEFIMHGVVGLQNRGCVADVGDQYIQGAGQTGGQLLNICDQDWGDVLNVILESTIDRLLATFTLGHSADPNSIEVYRLDGPQEVALFDWTYEPANNTVVLDHATAPPAGTPILIRYDIAQ